MSDNRKAEYDVLAALDLDHQQFAREGRTSLFGDAAAEIRRLRAALADVAADLYRNHDMPPRKDSRSYSYRNGWWDGVHHAAKVVERAAREHSSPPGQEKR